jgi:carbamoyltransferase
MIQAFDLRAEKRACVPAVIHPVDGTTRPQIVHEKYSPRYHRLLSAFEAHAGVPVLLNTSFNDHGEPIVNTPSEALDTAETMDLDTLVIEEFLIER